MTKEHLGICLGLNLPFFVVITKIDITPSHVYQKTLDSICKVLKHPTVKKIPISKSDKGGCTRGKSRASEEEEEEEEKEKERSKDRKRERERTKEQKR